MSRSRLRARVRNAVFRAVKRVPRGALSPIVANDLFHAHESLFAFLGAFVSQRKVLFIGDQAYGAHAIRQGASSLTAVLPASAMRYARRTFAEPGLEFRRDVDDAQYDVVIDHGMPRDVARFRNAGKLLIAIPPAEDSHALRDALGAQFANVRRFTHIAQTPLDLSSPHWSALPSNAFSFRESDTSHDAIGIVYLATNEAKWRDVQLHLGCGPLALEGWINIDNQPYAGIDFRWDLARGIPFRNARYVFAEHFVEHLSYQQGADFTRECRAALRDDGILRLSTPNLDWVWLVSYRPHAWTHEDQALGDCFVLNRAFRGWGHQFLYNLTTLTALLQNSGFETVRALSYGESDTPALRGLERHQLYPDTPELPHVLVIEASGRREPQTIRGEAHIAEYNRDVATV
ncbi:MAG: class I SAM-dependent methyltransferase [Thermoanaerobaculia bacterium]